MAAEKKGQKNWQDFELEDLRHVDSIHSISAPEEIKKADSLQEAINILAAIFGLEEGKDETTLKTPVGDIVVIRKNLEHIVEKRQDGRERYANHALATVTLPFEVWLTEYCNDKDEIEKRFVFISLFNSKRQMLVVVSVWEENVLWNLMNTDKKNLNKHRHGKLIYESIDRKKATNK